MLYFRVTDERRDPGFASRTMISSRDAAIIVADKIYGDKVMAMFFPEKIARGSLSYCKLDPVTLTPRFGSWREFVEKKENRLLRTERLVWDTDDESPLLDRAKAHWALWDRVSKVTDPAAVVRRLFAKVMYPDSDVDSYHTGRTYFETQAKLYQSRGITDTPMTMTYRKTETTYHMRAPFVGTVLDSNNGGIILAGEKGRFSAKRPWGAEALVAKGQEVKTGDPLWRLSAQYKKTVAASLLADMWQFRIFSQRGETRYVHSQFVTRPRTVCQRCLHTVEDGNECPSCKVNGLAVAAIPVVGHFWIAGGNDGIYCKNVPADFPALPRLDDLDEVARHRRRCQRALTRNVVDKTEAPVMVDA